MDDENQKTSASKQTSTDEQARSNDQTVAAEQSSATKEKQDLENNIGTDVETDREEPLTDEEQLIICRLCDKKLTKPKCLPCVHSFCETCLGSYILEHANEENRTDSSFQCPVCRTVVVMPELSIESWINLLPKNRLIINLVEKISLQKATKCEPCQRGKEENNASSWCKDCGEALCEKCTVYHQRMKLLMEHEVVDLEEIKNQPMKLADTEEICSQHGGKYIEAYCHDHEKLCCVECITGIHRKCYKVTPLDDVSQGIHQGNEIPELSKRLANVDDDAIAVVTSRNVNIENLSRRQGDILGEIAELKLEINQHLDRIEEKIKEEFSIMHRALVEELKIQSQDFDYLHKSIENGQKVLKASMEHGTSRQIFVIAHKLKKLCEEHEWYIKSESGKIYHLEYDLDFETTLQTLTKNIPSVARISVKKSAANLVPAFMKDMHAIEVGELNGKCASDMERCWFTGGLFLTSGYLILADFKNSKLKCFNKANELILEKSLEGKPWDIAQVSESLLAVSMPEENKLGYFRLEGVPGEENFEEEFSLVDAKRNCHGITYSQDNIVIACSNQIRFMAKDGTLESSIDIGERGCRHIHADKDSRLLYSTKASVACMSLEGEDYFQYSSKDLRSPRGIASDKEGNYYVVGMDSNNVHQLSPKGKLIKILLSSKDGVNNPYAVGFEPDSTRVFVTQMDCDTVKLYKLVTKW